MHKRFIELRDYISGVNYALPAMLQGRYQQALNQWITLYETEKDKAIPKKKFAFARKQNVPKIHKPAQEEVKHTTEAVILTGNHLELKNLSS